MVELTQADTFDTKTGPATLLDQFGGRAQLIVQHVMFGRDREQLRPMRPLVLVGFVQCGSAWPICPVAGAYRPMDWCAARPLG
jgi:hypothetical protein